VQSAGNGGSGIVVVRYPSNYPELNVGNGLTYSVSIVSNNRVYQFTAGTGTVTFS
jgi:hypothetical protein